MSGIGRAATVAPWTLSRLLSGRHQQVTRWTAGRVLAITDPATCRPPVNRGNQGGRHGRRQSIWVDDVEILARTGHTPDSAATRLGVQRDSIYQHLRRRGRHDLWRKLRNNQ